MKRTLFICLSTYFTIVACNGLTAPPTGSGTEYPCGVWGVECSSGENATMCCPQNHICGYDGAFSRCPKDMCCYDGDDWPNSGISSESGKDGGMSKPRQPTTQYRTITIQRVGK